MDMVQMKNNKAMNERVVMDPEISILIITHNQRRLLERCLDSVLNQIIDVPYEIIISDDGDDDGTKEFVQHLSCSERVQRIDSLLELKYTMCFGKGILGWNRLNAYKQAKGKYFVNVDADDFLIGTDLYQKEYEMLEAHPECSMVQTRLLTLDDGDGIDQLKRGCPFSEKFENGAVFSLEDYLRYRLRGQHQTCMYRRRPQDDMEQILGVRFDDINITYYHIQFGPVCFLDITGYVWVHYPNSDSNSLNDDERSVAYGLIPLSLARLYPKSRYVFLGLGYRVLRGTIRTAPRYPNLRDSLRMRWSASEAFIYRFYSEHHHSVGSWARYWLIWVLLLVMKRLRLNSKFWLDALYRAMV